MPNQNSPSSQKDASSIYSYAAALVVVAGVVIALLTSVDLMKAILGIISIVLLLVVLGAFQLRNDKLLTEKSFLELMVIVLKKIPPISWFSRTKPGINPTKLLFMSLILPISLPSGLSFDLILVEGGPFDIGSTEPFSFAQEIPIHRVEVDTFYVGKYPVTQSLWKEAMGAGNNPFYFKGDKRPVETVSWEDLRTNF